MAVLIILGNLLVAVPVFPFSPPDNPANAGQAVAAAKGAANPNELAHMLLQSIQTNKFENLNALLLDDAALTTLKKKGSEDIKALLENSSAEEIKSNLRTHYQEIIQQGISRTINWSEVEVSEARLGKGTAKNPMVQPVTIMLTDKENHPVQLLLETAKLNNRYFLFQRMELKP